MKKTIKIINKNNTSKNIKGIINITGSKSESNRALIINSIYKNILQINNLSNSEDTEIMINILNNKSHNNKIYDIHHAGTTMRFLTAYFAIQNNNTTTLTGSARMKERPIKILVNCLKKLGANIKYLNEYGFPPIKIYNYNYTNNTIDITTKISSQYISALMLIGSKIKKGLKINLIGNPVSQPYINMTLNLLNKVNVLGYWKENYIYIPFTKQITQQYITIESDWSSASYYYSLAALSKTCLIKLKMYKKNSLQGDSKIVDIYKKFFNIKTKFTSNNTIILTKIDKTVSFYTKKIHLNLQNTPDIAQTIIITCVALKIKCYLTGLSTLKIKETDRLKALHKELLKLGVITKITRDSIEIIDFKKKINLNKKYTYIETYNDHRMAMSFTPLCLKYKIGIINPDVVNKSYPDFWKDLKKLGIYTELK